MIFHQSAVKPTLNSVRIRYNSAPRELEAMSMEIVHEKSYKWIARTPFNG